VFLECVYVSEWKATVKVNHIVLHVTVLFNFWNLM